MVKRKGSTNGDVSAKSNKKVKKVSEAMDEITENTKLDMQSPLKLMSSLVKPTTVEEFFSSHWEKKPLHIKRDDTDYYGDLFTLEIFKNMLKDEELNFETDVNVCRYVDNEKELLNEEGRITVEKMQSLMKDKKATFQVHQPQRFVDGLWGVIEKLETYLGSLVGTNVYITPGGAQGLAPHCDDVEIIVLQLEGKKTWKLYKPMVELSRDYTQDLKEADIGEPIMEITLQPGDLLYFPRGTIHQAKTEGDSHSTHLSVSTYQQNTWGDFMNHAVTQAIENALEDNVSVRTGLPINYSSFLGTSKNMGKYIETEDEEEKKKELPSNDKNAKVIEFKETIKKHLANLIDHIDVNTAADAMCTDFMMNRLPPYGHKAPEDDEEDIKDPSLEDEIQVKYPEHVRIVYSEEDDEGPDVSQVEDGSDTEEDDEKPAAKDEKDKKKKKKSVASDAEDDDEDDEDVDGLEEEPCIRILHSLNNDRQSHMLGDALDNYGVGSLKLPLHFGPAAIALLESKGFIKVKDLLLDDDQDKMVLVATMFADDLLEIKSK